MNDRVDSFVAQKPPHKFLIAAVADHERYARRNRPVVAGGKVVEHDDVLAGLGEFEHHVTADIARSAGDQHCHVLSSAPECAAIRRKSGTRFSK